MGEWAIRTPGWEGARPRAPKTGLHRGHYPKLDLVYAGLRKQPIAGIHVAKAGRKETRKRRLCRIRRLPDDPSLVLGCEPHQTTPILTARSSIFGNFFWRQKNFAAASPLNLRDVNRCFHRSNPRLHSFTFGNLQYRPSWICKFVSKKDVTRTTIRPRKFKKNRKTPVCTVV